MYTLGLILVTCFMPCAGLGLGAFFWRKGMGAAGAPARGAVPGEILVRIGRLAVLSGAVAAAVTVLVVLLTGGLERPWRVGAALVLVTAQYVVTIAVVIRAAQMIRKK